MGIFFFALQLKTWYKLLIGMIEDVVYFTREEKVLMSYDLPTQK